MSPAEPPAGRRRWATSTGGALGLALVLAFNLFSLTTYPPPTCDEVAYADAALSLLHRLRPRTASSPVGRDINVVHHPRLYGAGLAATFSALGVHLVTGRLYSLLGWLLAGLLTYRLGLALYGPTVGLVAALLFLSAPKALLVSHTIRPESWVTAAVLLAIYAAWVLIERKPTPAMAAGAGVLAIVPLDFHANALAFLPALMLAVTLATGWRQRKPGLVAWYLAGILVAFLLWLVGHAWLDPHLAWRQFMDRSLAYTSLGSTGQPSRLIENLWSIGSFWHAIYWTAGKPLALAEALLGLGGLALAFRRASRHRFLATIVSVSMVAFALGFSQRFVQYGVLWTPLLFLLGTAALDEASSLRRDPTAPAQPSFPLRWLARRAAIGLIVLNLAGTVWLAYRFSTSNFAAMSQDLSRLVPPGARVMAESTWWWALRRDRVFLIDELFLDMPNVTMEGLPAQGLALLQRLHPDYVLLDSAIGCQQQPTRQWFELQASVGAFCRPVGRLHGARLGDVGLGFSVVGQSTSVFRCDYP